MNNMVIAEEPKFEDEEDKLIFEALQSGINHRIEELNRHIIYNVSAMTFYDIFDRMFPDIRLLFERNQMGLRMKCKMIYTPSNCVFKILEINPRTMMEHNVYELYDILKALVFEAKQFLKNGIITIEIPKDLRSIGPWEDLIK